MDASVVASGSVNLYSHPAPEHRTRYSGTTPRAPPESLVDLSSSTAPPHRARAHADGAEESSRPRPARRSGDAVPHRGYRRTRFRRPHRHHHRRHHHHHHHHLHHLLVFRLRRKFRHRVDEPLFVRLQSPVCRSRVDGVPEHRRVILTLATLAASASVPPAGAGATCRQSHRAYLAERLAELRGHQSIISTLRACPRSPTFSMCCACVASVPIWCASIFEQVRLGEQQRRPCDPVEAPAPSVRTAAR